MSSTIASMVGVPGDRSGAEGGPGNGCTTFLLTTNPALTYRGIGRGATRAALRRTFPAARECLLAVFDPTKVRGIGATRAWLRRSA